jgi:anti-sigma factor RsiW
MSERTCQEVQDVLVAYADGDLPETDARRIGEHVAQCTACRAELQCLHRSVELAREIWLEPSGERRPARTRAKPSYPAIAGWAACAAALLLIVGFLATAGLQRGGQAPALSHNGPSERKSASEESASSEEEVASHASDTPEEADDIEEIERWINRRVQAARLAAAAEILGSQPELESYKQQAEQYLAAMYGPDENEPTP